MIWVRSELVAEIEHLDGAGALRHVSFEGLRFDKPAGDVVAEGPVTEPLRPYAPASAAPMPATEGMPVQAAPVPAGSARGFRGAVCVTVASVGISNLDRSPIPRRG